MGWEWRSGWVGGSKGAKRGSDMLWYNITWVYSTRLVVVEEKNGLEGRTEEGERDVWRSR